MRSTRSGLTSVLLRFAGAGALASLAAFGAACGTSFSEGSADGAAGDDPSADAAADDARIGAVPPPDGTDGGHDAGIDTASPDASRDAAEPPIDATLADTSSPDVFEAAPPCDPTHLPNADGCVIADAYGIFVSSSRGSAAGTGSQVSPLNSIGAAIPVAVAAGKRIYVCAENYAEALTLASNVAIFGYFDCNAGNWSVGAHHANVNSPASPGVTASNVVNVRLEGLNIAVPSQASVASASAYGVFAVGSSALALVDVQILSGAAGSGTAGGSGTAPSALAYPCTAGDGAPATTRIDGKPGSASYSSLGYAAAKGGDGTAGAYGDNGTTGTAGSCHQTGACKASVGPPVHCDAANACSQNGYAGCGGPGGAAGMGGTGGGSSIALFAWGSTISVTGGTLAAGQGGNGGAGGAGATAPSSWATQSGGKGAASSWSGGCTSIANCTTTTSSGALAGGGAGGPGGQGAQGGFGAGGSGGDSYSYYASGGATVTVSVSTQMSQAGAGTGGQGTVAGASGYAAAVNTAN